MADANKTERGTPRKRKQARESGQVPRSREIGQALSLLAGISILVWQAPHWPGQWSLMLGNLLAMSGDVGTQDVAVLAHTVGSLCFRWAAPVMLSALAISIGSMVVQGGFLFTAKPLTPNFEKLNPAKNLGTIFSISGLSRMLKTTLPFLVIVYVCGGVLLDNWKSVTLASTLHPKAVPGFMFALVLSITWKAAFVLAVWAAVDYALQRRSFENSLKMSKTDVRDEAKEGEGNPQVKGKIKRLQRQMRKRRMLKDVETATVVVTNPTHFAVALRFDIETMSAPVVLAKGQNLIAQEIKEIARWNNVPMVENKPLAQALYRSVEVGMSIPPELYLAVAEILAFIFRMQQQARSPRQGEAAGWVN